MGNTTNSISTETRTIQKREDNFRAEIYLRKLDKLKKEIEMAFDIIDYVQFCEDVENGRSILNIKAMEVPEEYRENGYFGIAYFKRSKKLDNKYSVTIAHKGTENNIEFAQKFTDYIKNQIAESRHISEIEHTGYSSSAIIAQTLSTTESDYNAKFLTFKNNTSGNITVQYPKGIGKMISIDLTIGKPNRPGEKQTLKECKKQLKDLEQQSKSPQTGFSR